MARPKKWASDAERMAAKRRVNEQEPCSETRVNEQRSETPCSYSFVAYKPQNVPLALFDGCGRGTVRTHTDGRRYVMVSRHVGPDVGELGVVTHADWLARLDQRCAHGHAGWACHAC